MRDGRSTGFAQQEAPGRNLALLPGHGLLSGYDRSTSPHWAAALAA